MRLWHYKLIPFLPDSQLLAQWRELNSIFKKQDKHILINYIYEYSKTELACYTNMIIKEMNNRGFEIKSMENFLNYFKHVPLFNGCLTNTFVFENHHNQRYLIQCFYNLEEKYNRGQKDFSKEQYEALNNFVMGEISKRRIY